MAAFGAAVAGTLAERASDDLSQARQDFERALKVSRSWQWFVEGYALQLFALVFGIAGCALALATRWHPVTVLLGAFGASAVAISVLVALARPDHAERVRLSMLLRARHVRCRNCGVGFFAEPSKIGAVSCPYCSAHLDATTVEEIARAASRAQLSARMGAEAKASAEWRAAFRSLREDGRYRLSNAMLLASLWLIGFAAWTTAAKATLSPERLNQPVEPLNMSSEYVNGVPLAVGFMHGGGYVLRGARGGGEGVMLPERRDPLACVGSGEASPVKLADLPLDTRWGSVTSQSPEQSLGWFRHFYGERAVPALPVQVGGETSVGVRLEGKETTWEAHAVRCGADDRSLLFVRQIQRSSPALSAGVAVLALGSIAFIGRKRRASQV